MAKKPLNYNYAKDREFAEGLKLNLLDIFEKVRTDRSEREEIWQGSYRAWSVVNEDGDRNYDGRANLYIPQLRKEIETMSRRIVKGIFPEDYLRAEPNRFESDDITQTNTQVVRHYFDNVMDFKQAAEPWIKQGVLFGSSPIRSFWCKKENEQFIKERVFDRDPQGRLIPRIRTAQKMVTRYKGPVARAEHLFNVFVYPATARDIRDIQITFYRTKIKRSALEAKEAAGEALLPPEIPDMGKDMDTESEEQREQMAAMGQSGELYAVQDDKMYDLLEVWLEAKLPDGEIVPVVVEIINEQVISRVQRNPFWHQMPPFDWFRFIKGPPGEFYGRGLPEASLPMQHQLNDMVNQGMDSATLALNNITIINPAFAPNADSFEIEPGAKWWADPNGVKQFQFPDLSDTAIKNAGMVRAMITEMSDNSPQLPDPIAGKARSTGQAQLAVNEWQTDLYSFLESLTAEGLNPLAKKVHVLLQQNLTDDDVIRVTGKYAGTWLNRIVTPDQILGNLDFKWIGGLQIEQQSIRIQQMLNFIRVYQSVPEEARGAIKFNWNNFFIKLLRDGFLIKDVHNIVETSRQTASVDPILEGRLIEMGGDIKVQKSDQDEAHIQIHKEDLAKLKPGTENFIYKQALLQKHIVEHEAQIREKAAAAQEAQMMRAMMMQQMAAPQGNGRGGKQTTPGNLGQINESTDQSDIMRGQRA
jgi:hypothetical protein